MSASPPIVFVVDDDPSFRPAIARSLRTAGLTVETFASGAEFLARLRADPPAAGCALLDLHMPQQDGLQLQTALARLPDPLPVVFLTGQGDIRSSVAAMRRGAEDFLPKTAPRAEILAAIGRALAREATERAARNRRRETEARIALLTPRENEVLAHVLRGALNKQIADALRIDLRSVKRHRTSFMAKLQVDSVARLVELAHVVGHPSPKGS